MAALPLSAATTAAPHDASSHRAGVYDLFRDHLQTFARLPGEVSNFEQSGPGYQWHCEFALGDPKPAVDAGGAREPLRLHFFLVDTEGRSRPVAALYLVAGYPTDAHLSHLVHLNDLAQALDDLNGELAERDGMVEMSVRANQFIEELSGVKQELGSEVIWQ